MKIKNLILLGAISLSIAPYIAFADLTIVNNTTTAATASVQGSPCSNVAGNMGILQPHGGHVTVKDWMMNMYCKKGCTGHLYMNKSCSGKSVATITGSTSEGVIKVDMTDKSYKIVGTGKNVSIEGGPSRKWYQLFF